jgi:hypothetical protein
LTITRRANLLAITVMAVVTTDWVILQASLVRDQAHEAAIQQARRHVAAAMKATAEGLQRPQWVAPEIGIDYWRPIVVASGLQLLALSAVALLLVAAGRRRSWLPLAVAIFAYPTVAALPNIDLRPIGAGWQPAAGGGPGLTTVGAFVDLVVVTLPAVVYLLSTRGSVVPNHAPARKVIEMVTAPAFVIGSVLASYGMAEISGGGDRVVAALLVLVTAGLLASTNVGVWRGSAVTTVAAVIAAQPSELSSVPLVLTAAVPLAAIALTGAVCAVYGSTIATAYRTLVRRPVGAQLSA